MNPLETPALPEIIDIVPPGPVGDPYAVAKIVIYAMIAAAILIPLAIRLLRHLRRRVRLSQEQSVSPHVVARRQLDTLEREIDQLTPNELTVQVSNVVKEYVHRRYGDPVLFETAEEFVERDFLKKPMPSSKRKALADFLVQCQLVKFSRFPEARSECDPLVTLARRLIHEPGVAPAVPAPSPHG